VLGIISRSPTDVQPVLDAIVESAARVCGIDDVVLRLRDGDAMVVRAHFGSVSVAAGREEVSMARPQIRWIGEHGTLHVPDVHAQDEFPRLGYDGGVRTFLAAPLRQQGEFIGMLAARRIEVRPFTAAQIKLMETFADQAVIAMENSRLFSELQGRVEELRALGALERVEWRRLGSELEAALEELRLIRELRPPANARAARSERYVYLQRRGDRWATVTTPGPLGPITSRNRARAAARALEGFEGDDPAAALPRLREKLRRLARDLRFEDAARVRDRLSALEDVVARIAELDRLRALRVCLLAPALEPGFRRAFLVAGGRLAAVRTLPDGAAGRLELQAGIAKASLAHPSFAPEDSDELLVVAGFLRRPGPELSIVPLDSSEILAA
jgi:GAF domain-containing protein